MSTPQIVAVANGLPAAQPVESCPTDAGPTWTVRFTGASGQTLAQAVEDGGGCDFTSFAIGGVAQDELTGALGQQSDEILGITDDGNPPTITVPPDAARGDRDPSTGT